VKAHALDVRVREACDGGLGRTAVLSGPTIPAAAVVFGQHAKDREFS
jgi:hypothetical protein